LSMLSSFLAIFQSSESFFLRETGQRDSRNVTQMKPSPQGNIRSQEWKSQSTRTMLELTLSLFSKTKSYFTFM
jgi:hypothetical protein